MTTMIATFRDTSSAVRRLSIVEASATYASRSGVHSICRSAAQASRRLRSPMLSGMSSVRERLRECTTTSLPARSVRIENRHDRVRVTGIDDAELPPLHRDAKQSLGCALSKSQRLCVFEEVHTVVIESLCHAAGVKKLRPVLHRLLTETVVFRTGQRVLLARVSTSFPSIQMRAGSRYPAPRGRSFHCVKQHQYTLIPPFERAFSGERKGSEGRGMAQRRASSDRGAGRGRRSWTPPRRARSP